MSNISSEVGIIEILFLSQLFKKEPNKLLSKFEFFSHQFIVICVLLTFYILLAFDFWFICLTICYLFSAWRPLFRVQNWAFYDKIDFCGHWFFNWKSNFLVIEVIDYVTIFLKKNRDFRHFLWICSMADLEVKLCDHDTLFKD